MVKSLSEEDTKLRFITPAIFKSGWTPSQILMEYVIKNDKFQIDPSKHKTSKVFQKKSADYVLCYIPNVPIAVIEAKKYDLDDSQGIDQAIAYAKLLDVPFAYATSGKKFVEFDIKSGIQREIDLDNFPTPQQIWSKLCDEQSIIIDKSNTLIKAKYYTSSVSWALRYYQLKAINRTINAIVLNEQKRILLVMATGTGKTFTAFQIVHRLKEAGIVKNVLYLADRNQLVDQTMVGDFKSFNNCMCKIQKGVIDKSKSIFFGLYQQLSRSNEDGLKNEDYFNYKQQVSPNFFDLIVVDECHRGSAREDSAWRDILDYFKSAIQIGLTATPNTSSEANNLVYFGEPVFTYSLKEGIDDGYLAPYMVISHILDKDQSGWEPEEGELDANGRLIPKRLYSLSDFDLKIEIQARINLVASIINDYIKQIGAMSKTIIFCSSQRHALKMRDALRKLNPEKMKENPEYIVRMTSDDIEGKSLYSKFTSINQKYPVIVTTSKLLTTGADTQCVKLIVLDAPIGSMTEFKQIVGRGTRLVENAGKTFFTILDFRGVSNIFKDPNFDGDIPIIETPTTSEGNGSNRGGKKVGDNGERDDNKEKEPMYEIKDVDINLIAKEVSYLDLEGRLIPEKFIDYTRTSILELYGSHKNFIEVWNSAEQKQEIIKMLEEKNISIKDIETALGTKDMDIFDMICFIAYNSPKITRKDRANRIRKSKFLEKYQGVAREVMNKLIDRYLNDGIKDLETPAVFKLREFNEFGGVPNIIRSFGGKEQYFAAIRDLEANLYSPVINKNQEEFSQWVL